MFERKMPLAIGIVCLILAISSLAFTTVMAVTSYQIKTPFVATLQTIAGDLRGEAYVFNLNPVTMTYDTANVDIKNYGSATASGIVYMYLYGIGGIDIGSGSSTTGNIAAGATQTVNVNLVWSAGYNVTHLARVDVVITES